MYSFEIGYMSDKLRVVNGENVELEVFESEKESKNIIDKLSNM